MATQSKPPVLVLDNDETLGSWGDLSLLYSIYTTVLLRKPSPSHFAEIVRVTRCVRPHLRNLFQEALEMKKKGKLSSIVLLTAASNASGWVTFCSQVLASWFGEPIFDLVISSKDLVEWNMANGHFHAHHLHKDLYLVLTRLDFPLTTPTIVIDDRVEWLINHTKALSVSPYKVAVNLIELCRHYVEGWSREMEETHAAALGDTWTTFLTNPRAFTDAGRDRDLEIQLKTLRLLVA